MRSMWKGAISFGLVNIPVKLYTATKAQSISFNLLHEECKTPIQYRKTCPTCEREVEQAELVRGYEFAKGRYVVITDEEYSSLQIKGAKTVEIVQFVNLAEIDPVYYNRTYFLEPNEGGQKAYALLHQTMANEKKAALAHVVLRNKQSLAAVRVYDDRALVMETMFFPAEVRSPGELAGIPDQSPVLQDKELKIAKALVEQLTSPFDPKDFPDEQTAAVSALIESKVSGNEIALTPLVEPNQQVVDLMTALEASLADIQQKETKQDGLVKV